MERQGISEVDVFKRFSNFLFTNAVVSSGNLQVVICGLTATSELDDSYEWACTVFICLFMHVIKGEWSGFVNDNLVIQFHRNL